MRVGRIVYLREGSLYVTLYEVAGGIGSLSCQATLTCNSEGWTLFSWIYLKSLKCSRYKSGSVSSIWGFQHKLLPCMIHLKSGLFCINAKLKWKNKAREDAKVQRCSKKWKESKMSFHFPKGYQFWLWCWDCSVTMESERCSIIIKLSFSPILSIVVHFLSQWSKIN